VTACMGDASDGGADRGQDVDSTSEGRGGRPCPACGRPMYRRHCKYVCPSHGVVFDCSDTFY
jgi:hypothetical protein